MPTPAEKRALVFLSAMLTLGAGVRATKALSAEPPPPSAAARAELHRQIVAVDSADSAEKAGGGKRHRSKRPRAIGISTSDGSDAARADSSNTRKRKKSTKILPQAAEQPRDLGVSSAGPVDLDRAQEWEILALPKIGPTLAHRILANRDSLGPFGSLDELRRVKGVGEAVVDAITPYVTFSQQPRQSRENQIGGGAVRRLEKRRKRQSPSQ